MSKILCIEDEPDLLEFLVDELDDAGYATLTAANGRIGLEIILDQMPDLILCDIMMPEMDGKELLATLRRDHPECADIPFIFLTALANRDQMLAGLKLGSDDYLTKPVDFEMMLAKVATKLAQVDRMKREVERQMVTLYKALTIPDASNTELFTLDAEVDAEACVNVVKRRPHDIIVVGSSADDDIDLRFICDILTKNNHRVRRFRSGKDFLSNAKGLKADLTFIHHHTEDFGASIILNSLEKFKFLYIAPFIRFLPHDFRDVLEPSPLVTDYFNIPGSEAMLLDKIETWVENKEDVSSAKL